MQVMGQKNSFSRSQ